MVKSNKYILIKKCIPLIMNEGAPRRGYNDKITKYFLGRLTAVSRVIVIYPPTQFFAEILLTNPFQAEI